VPVKEATHEYFLKTHVVVDTTFIDTDHLLLGLGTGVTPDLIVMPQESEPAAYVDPEPVAQMDVCLITAASVVRKRSAIDVLREPAVAFVAVGPGALSEAAGTQVFDAFDRLRPGTRALLEAKAMHLPPEQDAGGSGP
jgi:hypothetical protein